MALIGAGSSLGGMAGGAATARLLVVVSGNTSALSASLAAAGGSLRGFAKNATAIGGALTRSVTLPLAAIGGMAIKTAMDWESSMARIQTLTTVLGDSFRDITAVEQKLFEIASKVPTPILELGESLYYAGSAGLEAADALRVVELSAQAAAAGMGRAEDISKVLIFALNNFSDSGLTAERAMDMLTAAIREGTAAPEELAISLGRLLPIAEAAGISFDQVVASVAALTNVGLPARVTTTSLRAAVFQLQAPTIQTTKALDELGISTEQLRQVLELGPLPALQFLTAAVDGNFDALRRLLPQVRGFTAAMGLTGDMQEKVAEIMLKVKNSTGDFGDVMEVVSKTKAYQFGVAMNNLRIAGVELGRDLIPVASAIFRAISSVSRAFSSMPPGVQSAAAALIVFAAAAGPVLKLSGLITNNFTGLLSGTKAMALGLAVGATAAVVAAASFSSLLSGTQSMGTVAIAAVSGITALTIALRALQYAVSAFALRSGGMLAAFAAISVPQLLGIAAVITAIGLAVSAIIGSMNVMGKAAGELAQRLFDLGAAAKLTDSTLRGLEDNKLGDTFRDVAEAAGVMGRSLSEAIVPMREALPGMILDFIELAGVLDDPDLVKYVEFFESIRGQAVDIGPAMREAGLEVGTFVDELSRSGQIKPFIGVSEGVRDAASEIEELIYLSGPLVQSQSDLEAQTLANILAFADEEKAIEDLANQTGLTTDQVTAGLNEMGIGAEGFNETSVEAFKEVMGVENELVDNTKQAKEEMKQALAEIAQGFRDTFSEAFDIFGEAPEKIKKSTAGIIRNAEAQARSAAQAAANIGILLQRGLDPAFLAHLVSQGPAMVAKFVDASEAELRRLETAYELQLGAIDADIFDEATHQKEKGGLMVAQFTEGILSNNQLPIGASKGIVTQVAGEYAKGNLKDKGVQFIYGFANGITSAAGVPKAQSATLISELVRILASGKGPAAAAGREEMVAFAKGLLEAAGIPKKNAADILQAVVTALMTGQYKAHGAGSGLTSQFAAGILASKDAAVSAAASVSAAAAAAFDNSLFASPKYFSYYSGRGVVRQFAEGMSKEIASMPKMSISSALEGNGSFGRSSTFVRAGTINRRGPSTVVINVQKAPESPEALDRMLSRFQRTRGW